MNEILNSEFYEEVNDGQVISQQKALIEVLKQEIIRLQEQIHEIEREKNHHQKLYESSLLEIEMLNQKIDSLKENNESLFQTLQVFQREFVKRDYKNSIAIPNHKMGQNIDGPFFMELIRSMKARFTETSDEQPKVPQKSYLSEYYGYFFHSQLEEIEADLYREVAQLKQPKPSKIRSFGKKNYFNQKFRHYFWFNIIENPLNITYALYELLLDQLDGNRENENLKPSIIDMDLHRMDLKLDEEKSKSMKVEIKKCLEIFSLYRADIGYVQGMSYLAWMFLIRMENYQAFFCFSNIILCDPFINSLYMFKQDKIKTIIKYYEECLEDKKPKLLRHMNKLEVDSELFIIEWAYTFFSRAFSLRITSKIWDLWFSEGFNVFFKVAMVILEMLEASILEQFENDKIIEILRTQTHKLDESEFLRLLQKQKLFDNLKL